MNAKQTDTGVSLRAAALVGAVGLLLMIILAIFAYGNVIPSIIISNDAAATVENLRASSGLFRLAVSGFVIVAILDVIVAWALYLVFKPANPALSLLAAWLRVAYAPIFVAALGHLFMAVRLASGTEYLSAFGANGLNAQVMLSVSAFNTLWDMGLAVFGLHLLVAGYLAFTSGYVPKWLSVLLLVAGLGYVVDSFWKLLWPGTSLGFAQFTGMGEAALIFWLFWKSYKGFGKGLE